MMGRGELEEKDSSATIRKGSSGAKGQLQSSIISFSPLDIVSQSVRMKCTVVRETRVHEHSDIQLCISCTLMHLSMCH